MVSRNNRCLVGPAGIVLASSHSKRLAWSRPFRFYVLLSVGIDVLLPGSKEIQEVDTGIFASLAYAEQDKVILDPLLSR